VPNGGLAEEGVSGVERGNRTETARQLGRQGRSSPRKKGEKNDDGGGDLWKMWVKNRRGPGTGGGGPPAELRVGGTRGGGKSLMGKLGN